MLQQRQQNGNHANDAGEEGNGDQGRRQRPRQALGFQTIGDRVEEIGHRHARDEGQQNGAQQVDQ